MIGFQIIWNLHYATEILHDFVPDFEVLWNHSIFERISDNGRISDKSQISENERISDYDQMTNNHRISENERNSEFKQILDF